jgi:AraC-like DNA-binding protein
MQICFRIGIPVGTLLASRRLAGVSWPDVTAHFRGHDRHVNVRRSREEVQKLLKAALQEDDYPSVQELSKRLGYRRHSRLYQVDPILCRRITAKHRACKRTHWWKQPGAKRISEIDAIRSALEQSLAQNQPMSVRSIATQLGYANAGFIHRKFPDLCHAIAEKLDNRKRHRFEELRQAVNAASLEDPPPTLQEVSGRLGFQNSSTLRSWFPDELDGLIEARVVHAQKETAKTRAALVLILRGESAPSLSSVARQLGLSVSNLTEKYPDLCRKIGARFLQRQKTRTQERQRLLNEEVHRIARDLYGKGQNPTQARIMRLLSAGSLKRWGAIQSAVKRARVLLGLS